LICDGKLLADVNGLAFLCAQETIQTGVVTLIERSMSAVADRFHHSAIKTACVYGDGQATVIGP
jgi:hypothetical protein